MTKLSQVQADKLSQLEQVHNNYKTARITVRRDIERQVQERLSVLRSESERLAYEAWQMGIPKAQIGRRGLGTSDPTTPAKYIEAYVEKMAEFGTFEPETPPYSIRYVYNPDAEMAFAFVTVDGAENPTFDIEYHPHVRIPGYIWVNLRGTLPKWEHYKAMAQAGQAPDEEMERWVRDRLVVRKVQTGDRISGTEEWAEFLKTVELVHVDLS